MSKQPIVLGSNYYAEPGETENHLHDIYAELPGGKRERVGKLTLEAVLAWRLRLPVHRPLSDAPADAHAMARFLAMHDKLPDAHRPAENTPLREALPGIWPTIGDLRALLVRDPFYALDGQPTRKVL